MKRAIFLFLPILALILTACSSIPPKTPAAPTSTAQVDKDSNDKTLARVDQQGAVTVTVIPLNLRNPGDSIDFDVSLQTHSVDLSMDLAALSTLTTDTGITATANRWNGPKGGHHVEGKLSFPASQNGKPVFEGARTVTLTIQQVDAQERSFTWEITK